MEYELPATSIATGYHKEVGHGCIAIVQDVDRFATGFTKTSIVGNVDTNASIDGAR